MRVHPTAISEVLVIEPRVHQDARGFFVESYHHPRYVEAGIGDVFVQDNHSRSTHRTLRGLHAQVGARAQAKLVRVTVGTIWDVAVDVRRGSPTFSQWVGVRLSAENFRQLYVPVGFVHGFCVESEVAEVEYKVSDVYDPAGEIGIRWNDPELAIAWPITDPVLSPKDRDAPLLRDVLARLPHHR